jgi:hypothetical protein
LLRGQSFRLKRKPCIGTEYQQTAWESLLAQVIKPLEDLGNTVEMVYASPPCELEGGLPDKLFGKRIIQRVVNDAKAGQGNNFRQALDEINSKHDGAEKLGSEYDYVMVTRHDTIWKERSLEKWRAKWSSFNFVQRCEMRAGCGGVNVCTGDIFHMMPGNLYPAFDAAVGNFITGYSTAYPTLYCFARRVADSGHGCLPVIKRELEKRHLSTDFGFLTQFRGTTRPGNDLEYLYSSAK